MDETSYLLSLKERLLAPDNWQQVKLTRAWASTVPSKAGVYVLREKDTIVYVGETGNLRGRMTDLLDSRQHVIRRTIGQKFFSTHPGFVQATTRIKFPSHIETMVNSHIADNLVISYIEVSLGRKELEELIEIEMNRDIRLNKRGKRKSR